jgi:hypothetical protein
MCVLEINELKKTIKIIAFFFEIDIVVWRRLFVCTLDFQIQKV